MTRARRDRGRGPSRWWRSVEAIAMGSALASALFAALAALGWRAGDAETNPVPTIVGLTIVALATWRIGRAAKRRAETIEVDERTRNTAPRTPEQNAGESDARNNPRTGDGE